jgi:hypothetical protein
MNSDKAIELFNQLAADYPRLFGPDQRYGGFGVGAGWEPILRKLAAQLDWLWDAQECPITICQIKEKFGGLRFYTGSVTDIMQACIDAAEHKSHQTCEDCGKYGTMRRGGWITCLCGPCAYAAKKPISEWEAKELGVTDAILEEPKE